MRFLERMLNNAVRQVAQPLIDEAAKHVIKQVKDSGVIESTVDDIAVSFTKDTKFAKIMKCPFCNSEYDNTLVNCPNCCAPNENRKFDYSKQNESQQ